MNQKEFDELTRMVRRIETALLGDAAAGITGVVNKINRHERQLVMIQHIMWVASGMAAIIGVLWVIFTELHK